MRDDYIILFLDDAPERAAILHQRVPERDIEHVVWVKTVAETLDMLKNYRERLREVSLDHDLGGFEYQHSGNEECGMEVVRWLEKQDPKDFKHVKFTVHSHNTHATVKMVSRLKDSGYNVRLQPFGMGKF